MSAGDGALRAWVDAQRLYRASLAVLEPASAHQRLLNGEMGPVEGIDTLRSRLGQERADLVILRAAWDYAERRPEFLAWTARVRNLLNAPAVVAWNSDKHYLADLAAVEKAIHRVSKVARAGDKEAIKQLAILEKCQTALNDTQPVRTIDFSKEELAQLKQFFLITAKPAMFVANVSEDGFENNPLLDRLTAFATAQGAPVVAICAKMEAELSEMDDADRLEFLQELGQTEPGLNRLIRSAYSLLGLQTYFTAGVKEVRAWTIHVGDTGPQAAGVIHTDFEKGYIRAQTIAFDDFISHKGEQGAKDAGKMRAEGKEYVVKDGDVLNFLFNV